MLPLRSFSLARPKNLAELGTLLEKADDKTKIIAGGTDLLPNLKHGLYDINALISLADIDEFYAIDGRHGRLSLGAMVSLQRVMKDAFINEHAPALAKAASLIASPQIRAMGTVGGNICLDTRCVYFNQTEFWRQALGYCLKKDGTHCHVVKTGKRCVAASSNDFATMLLAYDAEVSVMSPLGTRTLPLLELYTANGEKNNVLRPNEVISKVSITLTPQCYAGFAKLRHRQSFDFPLLSIGTLVHVHDQRLVLGRVVINALVAKPKLIPLTAFAGAYYDQALIEKIAVLAKDKCHPQSNMAEDQEWRRELIVPFTKRAFYDARPPWIQHHAV
ncbi:MAG TPA: FAD binding domain-containing protein [Myxococcota bacterium]|nr:FAD binding domain-containing protein [Myxococcota bacterium]